MQATGPKLSVQYTEDMKVLFIPEKKSSVPTSTEKGIPDDIVFQKELHQG